MGKRISDNSFDGLDFEVEVTEDEKKNRETVLAQFEEGVLDRESDWEDEDEPKSDEDPKDTKKTDKEEDKVEVEFDGLAIAEEPKATDDPLLVEMSTMTADDFKKLSAENPGKALEMVVTAVLAKRGINPAVSDMDTMTHAMTVRDVRKVIAARFQPHKNTELRDKAVEIYKRSGFDVRKNPQAELEAFILAASQNPALYNSGQTDMQNDPQGSPRGRRNPKERGVLLSRADLEMATKMGIDLSDPKVAKRIRKLKAHYQQRRRS